MATRQQMIEEARKYLGVKWHHGGRSRAGVDCAGLIIAVCRSLGVRYVDLDAYSHVPDGVKLRALLDVNMDRVPHGKQRQGDLALMRWSHLPVHMGLITYKYDPCGIIHAYALHRKVVEHPFSAEWLDRTSVFYQFRDLED